VLFIAIAAVILPLFVSTLIGQCLLIHGASSHSGWHFGVDVIRFLYERTEPPNFSPRGVAYWQSRRKPRASRPGPLISRSDDTTDTDAGR
jgi:hypothetical protein